MTYVDVVPLVRLPRRVSGVFTYKLGDDQHAKVDDLVLVKFRGKSVLAIVVEIHTIAPTFKTQPILKILPYQLSAVQKSVMGLLESCFGATKNLAALTVVPALKRINIGDISLRASVGTQSTSSLYTKDKVALVALPSPINSYVQEYIKAAANDGQVLMLLPDHVSLEETIKHYPQAVHWQTNTSTLATQSWQAVSAGSQLIIGTRTALFAPFVNLKAVVVIAADHELYQARDSEPHYNTMVLVRRLREIYKFKILQCQALPTLAETTGCIIATPASPARIKIIERRGYVYEDKKAVLSSEIVDEISASLGRVLIYLNKKGFAALCCQDCTYVQRCTTCERPLVYENEHSTNVVCGACGTEAKTLTQCPLCQSLSLSFFGLGINRLVKFCKTRFPDRPVIIIDATVTRDHKSFKQILQTLPANVIMIATSAVITRLWMLPSVSLAVVPRTDWQWTSTWRATEELLVLINSFLYCANLTLVETEDTAKDFLQALIHNDYKAYWQQERLIREREGYPPFGNLLKIDTKEPIEQIDTIANSSWRVRKMPNGHYVTIVKTDPAEDLVKLFATLPNGAKVDVNPLSIV